MNARQERTIAEMDAWLAEMRAWREKATACQEATEDRLEGREPISVEM
jgi:uncharacterized coiled-coil protein SlyX